MLLPAEACSSQLSSLDALKSPGESLPYLSKITKLGYFTILMPEEFHVLVKKFDEIVTTSTSHVLLELFLADIIIQFANLTEDAINKVLDTLRFSSIQAPNILAMPVS